MENEPYIIERTFNAQVEDVWKAITNKDLMKHWYFDLEEFKAEKGFKFQFNGGPEDKVYVHLCEVTEVEPMRKLTYSWSYDGYEGKSHVTFELFSEGDQTRLRLTHKGLESFPDDPAFARESFAAGWEEIIGTSLKEFVETESIMKSIEIDASDDRVWEVLTDLDLVREWAGAFYEGTYVESDWSEGAEVVWKGPDHSVGARGKVEVNYPPRILKVRFFDDVNSDASAPLGKYRENYTLTEHDGKTTFNIESGPLPRKFIKDHEPMWDMALELIKKTAEQK